MNVVYTSDALSRKKVPLAFKSLSQHRYLDICLLFHSLIHLTSILSISNVSDTILGLPDLHEFIV